MITSTKQDLLSLKELEYIQFERLGIQYIAILVDPKGFKIIKGYGLSPEEALNDLHKNLI